MGSLAYLSATKVPQVASLCGPTASSVPLGRPVLTHFANGSLLIICEDFQQVLKLVIEFLHFTHGSTCLCYLLVIINEQKFRRAPWRKIVNLGLRPPDFESGASTYAAILTR